MNCREVLSSEEWDGYVFDHGGHPLQLWGWGALKEAHRWRVCRIAIEQDSQVIGGAQLLIRRVPRPFGDVIYIPRGPFGDPGDYQAVLSVITSYVKRHFKPLVITIEPYNDLEPGEGWVTSPTSVLSSEGRCLDLTIPTSKLSESLDQKARDRIEKAAQHKLEIKRVTSPRDMRQCLDVYQHGTELAGFALHEPDYYFDVDSSLGESSVIFAAYYGGSIVSFIWLAVSAAVAFELYSGTTAEGKRLSAQYVLRWHAVTKSKEWGIDQYDLNYQPEHKQLAKTLFAPDITSLRGSFDYPLSPLYIIWAKGLPGVKRVVRRIKSLRK